MSRPRPLTGRSLPARLADPSVRRWFAPGIGLAAGIGALIFVLAHVRLENRFFDLMVYRSAVRWWVDGNPLYDYSQPDPYQEELGFTYPPVGAFLLRPLAYVPESVAIAGHVVISIACTAAALWWLTRGVAARQGWSRPFLFAVSVPVTAGLGAVWIGFDFGQINPVLWALVVFDLAVLAPRGSRLFGVGIGLATAIKLVPGLFIVYLLVTRRYRSAAVAAGTAAMATLLAHAAAPRDSLHYWTTTVWGGDGIGFLWFFTNQSISGVLARLYKPDPYPTWLWLGLCLPVLVYGLWRARQAARHGDELVGMAITGFVASLISPVTWVHHIFWWVPALLAIVDTFFARITPPPAPPAEANPPTAAPAISATEANPPTEAPADSVVSGLRNPWALAFVALLTYPIVAISAAANPGRGFVSVILTNWLVWLMLLLIVTLPIDKNRSSGLPPTRP